MGLIFITAGIGKILFQELSLQSETLELFVFPDFLPSALSDAAYVWIPRLELVIGVLLVTGITARLMAGISLVMITGFIANNAWLLAGGRGAEPCECFGVAGNLTQESLTVVGALYTDVAMLVVALIIIFCYQRGFFDIHPWFSARGRVAEKKDWSRSG